MATMSSRITTSRGPMAFGYPSRLVPMSPRGRDPSLRDIESRADCERLVRRFYGRAMDDPMIGFIFTDVARLDLEAHVSRIASFWETILLGAHRYSGGAFRPHARLHVLHRPAGRPLRPLADAVECRGRRAVHRRSGGAGEGARAPSRARVHAAAG